MDPECVLRSAATTKDPRQVGRSGNVIGEVLLHILGSRGVLPRLLPRRSGWSGEGMRDSRVIGCMSRSVRPRDPSEEPGDP